MIKIILDGQYGSCGKGAYAAWLAKKDKPDVCVRTGSPNAGHSIHGPNGEVIALRHIPAGCVHPQSLLVIPAGALICVDTLVSEIEKLDVMGIDVMDRLYIDPRATVIEDRHVDLENGMRKFNGSTAHGVGSCRAERAMRWAKKISDPKFGRTKVALAIKDAPHRYWTQNLAEAIRIPRWLSVKCRESLVHVEMTQGYGLSREFGEYPFVTSSNILPAQALVEMGVSCWDIETHMLMRTFPIRVHGNSGPLDHETSWEELAKTSDGYIKPEKTTVTKLERRIGYWSAIQAQEAVRAVNPDKIILMFGDYAYPDLGRAVDTDRKSNAWPTSLEIKYESKIAQMWPQGVDWELYRETFRQVGRNIHAISLGFGAIVKTPDWDTKTKRG